MHRSSLLAQSLVGPQAKAELGLASYLGWDRCPEA